MKKHTHSKRKCQAMVSRKIRHLRRSGFPEEESVAIAHDEIREEKGCRLPEDDI